ncbi:hypothetical protein, partial [Streptomyces kaempferi]
MNADAINPRNRRCSAPYDVTKFSTDTHTANGQLPDTSPRRHAGQCRYASFDTRPSVNNPRITPASVTTHAPTPPGNTTRDTAPRPR